MINTPEGFDARMRYNIQLCLRGTLTKRVINLNWILIVSRPNQVMEMDLKRQLELRCLCKVGGIIFRFSSIKGSC